MVKNRQKIPFFFIEIFRTQSGCEKPRIEPGGVPLDNSRRMRDQQWTAIEKHGYLDLMAMSVAVFPHLNVHQILCNLTKYFF